MSRLMPCLVFLALLDGASSRLGAATLHVSAGQSIQAAIDAAADGDEVLVAPGLYTEALNFRGRRIRVSSPAGPGETTISGAALGVSAVTFETGEGPESVLEGFTIRDGAPAAFASRAGGIFIQGADPTVRSCILTENRAFDGGGAALVASNAVFEDCVILSNVADGGVSNNGGGIRTDGGQPRFVRCLFSRNRALGSSSLGGGAAVFGGPATFEGCAFEANEARDGAGMGVWEGSANLIDCTFLGNTALIRGGGIFGNLSAVRMEGAVVVANVSGDDGGGASFEGSQLELLSCRFVGNRASDGGGLVARATSEGCVVSSFFLGNLATGPGNNAGGGMLNGEATHLRMASCVFSGNRASGGTNDIGGAMANVGGSNPDVDGCTFSMNSATHAGGGIHNQESSPSIANSILWSNRDASGEGAAAQVRDVSSSATTVEFSDLQGGWAGVGGSNLDVDPDFADPDGADDTAGTEDDDVRLGPSSPCIDAGNAALLPADDCDADLDGDTAEPLPRDASGAGRAAGAALDMGAHESCREKLSVSQAGPNTVEIEVGICECSAGGQLALSYDEALVRPILIEPGTDFPMLSDYLILGNCRCSAEDGSALVSLSWVFSQSEAASIGPGTYKLLRVTFTRISAAEDAVCSPLRFGLCASDPIAPITAKLTDCSGMTTYPTTQDGMVCIEDAHFLRGDVYPDNSFDISDGISILLHLFAGKEIPCLDAADVDDNGRIEITDAVRLLHWIFLGGSRPPEPVGACGADPTDDGLDCRRHLPCAACE